MKRLAFNGGEIAPGMALRTDMDVYARSCTELTNWDVAATGGIRRRRGMAHVREALPCSVLLTYRYSEEDVYLVELGVDQLRLIEPDSGRVIETWNAADEEVPWSYPDPAQVTCQQLNSILLLCAPATPVMELRRHDDGGWTFGLFEFATPPWLTEDLQDAEITITPTDEVGEYTFSVDDETAAEPDAGDVLRASYYTERAEAFTKASVASAGITKLTALTSASVFEPGAKLAVEQEPVYEYFICTAEWKGSTDFTSGFTSPANYPDNFVIAEDISGFTGMTAIDGLTSASNYEKGDKVFIRSGYWELWTCARAFSGATHLQGGYVLPEHYPSHFVRGVCIGEALPCGGTWEFFCSGTWHGSYEVRRSYNGPELTAQWEFVGESKSSIAGASNNILTGNEENEECWLRLFLTTVRYLHAAEPGAAWPGDYCGNKLIVQSYRRSMQLTVSADGILEETGDVVHPLTSPLTTADWSWNAFCKRFGYPRMAALHESRLVFVSTAALPQTIWMSRTDDLNNFTTGELDSHGLSLTMNTESQAAICWVLSKSGALLLGTIDGEWVINAPNDGALTPSNARINNQGRVGSSRVPAVTAVDAIIFFERGGGRVYEYRYSAEYAAYVSADLTVFADHIAVAADGITGGDVLRKPWAAGVFATNSGELLLMTYNSMHNVHAWHRYKTQGQILDVAVVPAGQNGDRLFMLVERNGTRRIEVMADGVPYTDGLEGYDYVSTMTTTAFADPQNNDVRWPASKLDVCLGTTVEAEDMELSWGEEWRPVDREGTLSVGWHELTAPAGWRYIPELGVRVRGPRNAEILAVQG